MAELLDLTEEDLTDLLPAESLPPPVSLIDLSEDDLGDLVPPPDPKLGIGQKLVGRFMGSDVDDPLGLTRAGAIAVGGISGGLAGSRVPRMPGPAGLVVNPVTGAVGFGLLGTLMGAVSPEASMEAAEALGFLPPGTREKLGLSNEDLRTVLEGEALLELATVGGLSAVRLTGRSVIGAFAGIGRAERQVAGTAAAHGIHLLPVQVGNRELARGYVSVMGRFPILGAPFRRGGQAAEDAARRAISDAQDRIGPLVGWHELGEQIFKDAKELLTQTNKMFGAAYDDVWRQADELEVVVSPNAVTDKATEILQKIQARTPAQFDEAGNIVAGDAGKVLEPLRNFIRNDVLPLRRVTESGDVLRVNQTYRQMDGLIGKIEQQLASVEPAQRKFITAQYEQLRQAAQLDMLQNVSAPNPGDALIIANRLKALDQNFSYTMSELFETSAANRFASVQKRGLRAVGIKKNTRQPIDTLAKAVVDTRSPQVIDELSRLVGPETMGRITAHTLDDAFRKAFSGGQEGLARYGGQFNPDVFAKTLGLDDLAGPQAKALERMLETSGSDLTTKHLQEIVVAAREIAGSEIPDVSSFIARRATIGGLRSAISAAVPGMALTGGTLAYGAKSLVSALIVIGGGRLLSNALANPANARFIADVLDKEATQLVRRNATLKVLRGGIQYMEDEGQIDRATAAQMERGSRMLMIELNEWMEQQEGNE